MTGQGKSTSERWYHEGPAVMRGPQVPGAVEHLTRESVRVRPERRRGPE